MASKCLICAGQSNKIVTRLKNRVIRLCNFCQVQFLDPQPTDSEIKSIYSENYYRAWGVGGPEDNEAVKRMKTATFNRWLNLAKNYKKEGRILDVGCATGYFLEAAKKKGFDPYGTEISSYAAAVSSKKFGKSRIFEKKLEDCEFQNGFFDAIFMFDLIEHTPNPNLIMKKSKEILKDDGIIMMTTPDHGSLTNRIMGKKWVHYKEEHLFYFNRKSMEFLANKNGFKISYIEPAVKTINLDYFKNQFSVYSNPVLTPIINLMHFLLKPAIEVNFSLAMGEMVVILKKTNEQ